MILETFATDALAAARLIRTVAILEIVVFLTFFHGLLHRRVVLPMLMYSGSVFSRDSFSDINNLPGHASVFRQPVEHSGHSLLVALPVA